MEPDDISLLVQEIKEANKLSKSELQVIYLVINCLALWSNNHKIMFIIVPTKFTSKIKKSCITTT